MIYSLRKDTKTKTKTKTTMRKSSMIGSVKMSQVLFVLCSLFIVQNAQGFQSVFTRENHRITETKIHMALKIGKNYKPKWQKKETLVDDMGGEVSVLDKGLIGTIPVIFKAGDEIKETVALPGQPISEVASQAGQFIKYGCGKGECGTCEAMCNGKWIRPCTASVPIDLADGEELVIQVKKVKNKSRKSGKFYSFRSIFMGFYNNVLGMVGMVITRRAAKKNYNERMEYEDMVAKLTAEKKRNKEKLP